MKKWYVLAAVVLLCTVFGICGKEAKAQETEPERHDIGKFTITHESGEVQTRKIQAISLNASRWTVGLDNYDFLFLSETANKIDSFRVQAEIWENEYYNPDSMRYKDTITLEKNTMIEDGVTLTNGGEIDVIYFSIKLYHVDLEVESLVTSASNKGFHPSKGNYLIIRSVAFADVMMTDTHVLELDVQITNNVGRVVYQEFYGDVGTGVYFDTKWNGKDQKTKAYVKDGTYKVTVIYSFYGAEERKTVTKSVNFKVSRKAPKGKKGLTKAKDIITLTGNPEIDFMAEKMVKAAGVKMNMSDEKKVKKIYHYMTKKFKHTHYTALDNKYKVHYKLDKLTPKIIKYMNKTDKLLAKGEVIYNYQYGFTTSWCMQRRRGVCDDHAEIFKILLNHVGVEAGVCGGYYLNRDGSKEGHAWNYAIVNGKKYYYDVDVEIQNLGKGQGDYYWYKKTKKQAKKNHKFAYES